MSASGKAVGFEVFENVGPSAVLAQGIFAVPSEALGQQGVAVEVRLVVAIGVNACHLCEDAFSDNRFVGGHCHATVAFHESAHLEEHVLFDACFDY